MAITDIIKHMKYKKNITGWLHAHLFESACGRFDKGDATGKQLLHATLWHVTEAISYSPHNDLHLPWPGDVAAGCCKFIT